MDEQIKTITNDIIFAFNSDTCESDNKWSLLNIYHNKYLLKKDFNKTLSGTYASVLTALLKALQPSLFHEKYQDSLFDDIFLDGILHESFIVIVNRLEHSDEYAKEKMLHLLRKFLQGPALQALFLYQCKSSSNWDLKYVSKSNVWDHLIKALVSLPDRIAKETKGNNVKVFTPNYYMPLILSTVLKVLDLIYESLKISQDCSLEFLGKLTGRICILGKADIVAKMYLKKFLNLLESDYLWRRICQNFISKMPYNSLDSFITNILSQIPWYGYVEWVLGDEGMKNEKINYIMTFKLIFFHSFKSVVILQNVIGYFASCSQQGFIKILDALIDSWSDDRSLRHQNTEQQLYIASALVICAGWLKHSQPTLNSRDYMKKILNGVQIRLGKSESIVHSVGMIVGGAMIQALDKNAPALEFQCPDSALFSQLNDLMNIPAKPDHNMILLEDLKYFEDADLSQSDKNPHEKKGAGKNIDEEMDSDDDLEPYDMSNDIAESKGKRPLYIYECMMGLIEQENAEWTETCLRHAPELIKANPFATEEVAEEMSKIMLHMTNSGAIPDFIGLRFKILTKLTLQCPIKVASYLASQFTERDYTIRQRLDILEVLASSSAFLAFSNPPEICSAVASSKTFGKTDPEWQLIINKRLEAKTKHFIKAQDIPLKENKFSAIAGNFFFPLLNSYEKACQILKLHGDDSYVLGRFINTLGIIMYSASNTLHCSQMGITLLQFLYSVRTHKDVFVRKSIIFAVAAVYTAVPSSILGTEMVSDVSNMTLWLQNVAENDFDPSCVEKAQFALSIISEASDEDLSFYQLKNLKLS